MQPELHSASPAGTVAAREQALVISTPGRICLFGEHQDYLHLPVIPCAISLRIALSGSHRRDELVKIALPDISSGESFSLQGSLTYQAERAYFRSAVNVMRREGYSFSRGLDCTVHGTIPINSGTSSSSALIVTWVKFLGLMSDQKLDLDAGECARLAHSAEVLEFKEPGGMMDHLSTAFGGVLAVDFFPEVHIELLAPALKTFVLGDSGEPKDTKGILARVKNQVLAASKTLSLRHPDFSLHTVTFESLDDYRGELGDAQLRLLRGTIRNRDITLEAKAILREDPLNHRKIGWLLNEHQGILRDVLCISTPKIDRMLDAACTAGGYGGKINGSGGGGCMFVYAPENPHVIAQAIEKAGGKSFVITTDNGTRVEPTARR